MQENYYDGLFNIKTKNDQKGFPDSAHYHRYEATPYLALDRLFDKYTITKTDKVIDFGCGKGRLNFYINHFFEANVVGIEMNEKLYIEALKNLDRYQKKNKKTDQIEFECCLAEEYEITSGDNRFYFFNPFSVQIFMKVINNILRSVTNAKRGVDIILYYPSKEYIYYLEHQTSFTLKEEIALNDIYGNNINERFLIYRL